MAVLSLALLVAVTWSAYFLGRRKGRELRATHGATHSLAHFHGWYVALSTALPMLFVILVWSIFAPGMIESRVLSHLPAAMQPADDLSRSALLREISNAVAAPQLLDGLKPEIREAVASTIALRNASGWVGILVALLAAAVGFVWSWRRLAPDLRTRNTTERVTTVALFACAAVAVLTTAGIVSSVLFETLHFFSKYPALDFLFGTQWSPQIAMRSDQVGQSGAFGFLPLLTGTLLIMVIAMIVAVPVGLMSAVYLSEYATPRARAIGKPVLELLAGVPTVVFGFFAALTVAPLIRGLGESVGVDVASESALAAGLVMGIMIIPFVSSLSDDVINAVPQTLRDGSYAMGATKSETIKQVVLPAALPGIVAAVMLAISRAVGETMIVVMAAGLAGKLTLNPLDTVTTITVQIKTLLVGDQEFDSVKTLSAFALGFVLFFFTLILNVAALRIVKRYRQQYD